jgi:hypothetical protein
MSDDVNVRLRITKTGNGAAEVVNDLKRVEQAAGSIGRASSTGIAQINTDFKSLAGNLRGMDLFGMLPGQLGSSISRMQRMLDTFAGSIKRPAVASGGATDMFAGVANMSSFDESIAALNANLEGTASTGAAAASSMSLLGPALLVGGVAAAGAAVAVGKLAYSLGTAGEAVVQTQKKFVAFTGGPQQAADALQAMNAATEGGMSSMDAMTYSSMLLSMGLAKNGEEAAQVSRMALMLGPAYRDASTNIQDFTMMLANQSIRRLDQFGLSIDSVKKKQAELVAAGMDKQLAFTNAVLDIGAQKMRQLEAAGVVAGTGIQQLTSAWADLRAEVGKELAPGVSKFQSGLATSLTELTNSIRANSSDAATQLMGLQAQMVAVRATYQTMFEAGVDPNGPYMQQYANTLAQIEARLITVRLAASDFSEAAGIAGVRAADGLTYTAATADSAVGALGALDDALQGLRDKDEAAKVNAVAMAILAGDISRATVEAIGLNAAFIELNKNKLGAMLGPEFWTSLADAKAAIPTVNLPKAPAGPAYGTGTDLAGQLIASQKATEVVTSQASAEVQQAHDDAVRAEEDRIKVVQAAAEKAADAIKAKWDKFANSVTKALDDASNKAKGLFDLGGGGAAGIVTEPGKNGPFEALYRITDVAATLAGRAPGADTAKWQEMYAGQDAMGIAKNFQSGNLLAKGVFENIDWGMLGRQATQQQESSKIASYAGQAVANLTQAGKPLTAEAIKAEIDKLAEKDKASLIPELQNVGKAVTATGDTAHGDAAVLAAGLATINSTLVGKQAAPLTTTPPTGKGAPPQTIPLFAAGTPYAPGGLAIVGERGPELINLTQGSRVYNAGQTANMLGGGRGKDESTLLTELARALNTKVGTMQQAGAALADMLVNAAAANVQTSMLRQFARR